MKWGAANSRRAIAPEDRVRQIEAAIFLIPFITYAYFYQGSDQSIACRFDLMRSMIEKRVLWIDDFCGFNTDDIITFHGHIYSVKAPGTSYTAMIPWLIFRIALLPLSAAHQSAYWALVTYLTTVFTTGLLVSALCVVMFRFARFLGASEGRAAGVALILGLATIAFPYATELTGEPVAAVCVFIAFYLLATFETHPARGRALAAGFLAGWAVLNDYPVSLVAAAIGIYAVFKLPQWTHLAAFSAVAAITVAILFAYNWGAFGSPFFFSYQAFKLSGNTQFPEQAIGFVGLTLPEGPNSLERAAPSAARVVLLQPGPVAVDCRSRLFRAAETMARRIHRHGLFVRHTVPVQRFVRRIDRIVGGRHRDRSAADCRLGSIHGPGARLSSRRLRLPAGRDGRAFSHHHADGDGDQSAFSLRI